MWWAIGYFGIGLFISVLWKLSITSDEGEAGVLIFVWPLWVLAFVLCGLWMLPTIIAKFLKSKIFRSANPIGSQGLTPKGRAEYRPLTYLACPYTCKTAKLRRERFKLVTLACKHLMETEGLNVFSPITHSHPLYEAGMRGDWDYWKRVDTEYLRLSEKVVVFMLPGWLEYTGVQAELKLAKEMGIPVEYLDPEKI